MRKISVLWMAMTMLIATTASAQYNDESGSTAFYAGQKTIDLLQKDLKTINKQISDIEKKMAAELKMVDKAMAAAGTTVVAVKDAAYQGEDQDTSTVAGESKWDLEKKDIKAKYEAELKPLKEMREKKLSQIASSDSLFYATGKTSAYSATNAINGMKGGPAIASTGNYSPAVSTVEYSGVINNPLWVDVNVNISGPTLPGTGKKGFYLHKGSTLEVSLPAGRYTAWRVSDQGNVIGNSIVFHVIPGVTHNYLGREVNFYIVVSK